jgi:hypothetical protein
VTNGEHDGEPPVRPGDDGEPELDVDSAFAAIVAGWGQDEPGPGTGSWPVAEDLSEPDDPEPPGAPSAAAGRPEPAGAPAGGSPSPTALPPAAPAADDADDERPGENEIVLPAVVLGGMTSQTIGPRDVDPNAPQPPEEGFVPPEPPPIPRGDLLTRLLWIGAIGGPLFLLVAAIAWQEAPRMLILAAVAAFVGGFVMLVMRMPHDREDDDDDGAVV